MYKVISQKIIFVHLFVNDNQNTGLFSLQFFHLSFVVITAWKIILFTLNIHIDLLKVFKM
jgi:hypothetical protein